MFFVENNLQNRLFQFLALAFPESDFRDAGISRKEVFQPHLPVRLPCYDLAPVISFTLGRCLGALQALPTSMA